MKYQILLMPLLILFLFHGNNLQAQAVTTDSLKSEAYRNADLQADYKKFKNTSIRFRPPMHFDEFRSEQASGYMNAGTAASIVAFEYDDTPYVGYYDALSSKAFGDLKDAVLTKKEIAKTDKGQPAQFFFYEFNTEKGMEVRRIIFFTGDTKQMVFMQANYPAMFDPFLKRVLMESFLTVQFE